MDLEQQTRTRSPRYLRLLLLAAGAAIAWLLLLGGPAQADDTSAHGSGHAAATGTPRSPAEQANPLADTVSRAAVPPVSQLAARTPVRISPRTVHAATAGITRPLRDLPTATTKALDTVTAEAPEPVRSTSRQLVATTVEPVLTVTTDHLADGIDRTAATADAVVDPVLQVAGAEGPARSSVSSEQAAGARTTVRRAHTAPTRTAKALEPAVTATSPVGHDGAKASGGAGAELPISPVAPDAPAAPAGSSAPGTAGVLTIALLPGLALLGRRLRAADEPLPAGPAFGPGSSPD